MICIFHDSCIACVFVSCLQKRSDRYFCKLRLSRGKRGGSSSPPPSKFSKNAQNRENAKGSTLARKRLFARKRQFPKSWPPNPENAPPNTKLGANFQMPKRSHEVLLNVYLQLCSHHGLNLPPPRPPRGGAVGAAVTCGAGWVGEAPRPSPTSAATLAAIASFMAWRG